MGDDSKHDEAASPLHATSTGHSESLEDPIPSNGTPKSDSQSVNTFADSDEPNMIPYPSIHSTQSPVNFALGNFFFAMSWISLIVFTAFSAVTWFTVLQDARSMTDWVLPNATGVSILGHTFQLDPDACVLSISWKVVVCGVDTSEDPFWDDVRVPSHCEPFDKALDIYLNDPSNPVFSFVPYTEPIIKRLGRRPPEFITKHRFDERGKWDPTEDLMVLFQHYSFNAFAFAVDPTTNDSVHVATFGVLDIPGDFVIRSRDVADTIEFTYDPGNGSVTTEVESRLLLVEITRSAISKAFAISMFLANWAVTVASVYITVLVAFGKLDANSVVAALPFSALLAIPTIRSLYVDSPPLRISVDAAAFFVQIATVGLCSLVLLRVLTNFRSPLSPSTGFSV